MMLCPELARLALGLDDEDDLPLPNPELAARYAAMTDEELLRELWLETCGGVPH